MRVCRFARVFGAGLALGLAGCSHLPEAQNQTSEELPPAAVNALKPIREKFAPDPHLAIFDVALKREGHSLVLTGDVDRPEARLEAFTAVERAGCKVQDRIKLLPAAELGDQVLGIVCLSVANGREHPDHKAEMGTQMLMGQVVRLWKATNQWVYVQSADGYLSWVETGAIARCARPQVEAWNEAPLLFVTAFEERILERPDPEAQSVSDVVMGDRVKLVAEQDRWLKVEIPDGRGGFLPKAAARDYAAWKQSRHASPDNIEQTAYQFLGRPYLWGGTSPKGLDCSGFVKFVFALNGVELNRNASEQSRQGTVVPLDSDFARLKKGDLLFFGRRGPLGQPPWVSHVGIYLGAKRFIQSSQRVRVSSFDPASPAYDARHARTLLSARRVLAETDR